MAQPDRATLAELDASSLHWPLFAVTG